MTTSIQMPPNTKAGVVLYGADEVMAVMDSYIATTSDDMDEIGWDADAIQVLRDQLDA